MILFLIGYMGCGKSSIGRTLAKRMDYTFVDMDSEIERECEMTISEIFATHGESYFRERESDMLQKMAHRGDNVVVATGGGVPCFGSNIQLMKSMGVAVHFKMSPAKLVQRLVHGRDKRPIIRGKSDSELLEFICDNLLKREPFYLQASLVIDCDGVSDDYIACHVVNYVENLNDKSGQKGAAVL